MHHHKHIHNDNEEKKKINWTGVAAFIAAMTAIPGVLINTYLDYQERATAALVQRSSYENLAVTVEEMDDDIKSCSNEMNELKLEIAELKGYLRGMRRNNRRIPAVLASPSQPDSSDKEKPVKSLKPPSYDNIMEHVQSTGQVYIQPRE